MTKKPENTLLFCACKVVPRVWAVMLVSTQGRNSIRAVQDVRPARGLEHIRFFLTKMYPAWAIASALGNAFAAASPRASVRGTSRAWRDSKAHGSTKHQHSQAESKAGIMPTWPF